MPTAEDAPLFADDDARSDGLDTVDPRLESLSDLLYRGRYAEAAALAESLWRQSVRDVRLLSPLLYGQLIARGVAGLPFIFDALAEALGPRWELIGPAHNKLPMAENAVSWLLQSLMRELSGHEKRQDADWQAWSCPASLDAVGRALDAAPAIQEALRARFTRERCLERFARLESWLRDYQALLTSTLRAPPIVAPLVATPASVPTAAATVTTTVTATAASSDGDAAAAPAPAGHSPALSLLQRKLALFERLVERRDFAKAWLVASDVQLTLKSFDPVVFLPRLFSPFFRSLSRHAEALEACHEQSQSPSLRALHQLYLADLDVFEET